VKGLSPALGVDDGPTPRVALVATMRDEGPYILEWIAYHRAIGFTDIVICTNDCVDGSPELLDRVHELGIVTHLRNEVGPADKPQLAAYAKAEQLPLLKRAEWAMVLDADEFLNIHVGRGTVCDLLDSAPHATAFLLNWRLFGSSGHVAWIPGFVTERFTRAARLHDPVNRSFKTLFTKIDAYGCKLLPHQPRFAEPERLGELCYVNGAGVPLPRYFWDESAGDFLQSEPQQVSWRLAQINHYNTRAWEDYLVKHCRGGGLNIAWKREASWQAFNKNDEIDLTITSKLTRSRRLFDALLQDSKLRRRHRRCCDLYREHIALLQREPEGGQTSPARH
jgi:Glycosyl transferase family 2